MKAWLKGALVGVLVWIVIFLYVLIYCFGDFCSGIGCLPCVILFLIPKDPGLVVIFAGVLALFVFTGLLIGWVIGEIRRDRKGVAGLR